MPWRSGPLARVLMLYASGHEPTKELANKALTQLDLPLRSDVFDHGPHGGPHARVQDLRRHDAAVVSTASWRTSRRATCAPSTRLCGSPRRGRSHAQGVGFTEAPRGALAHWIVIDDGKITNYQAVVPSTWNAGPRDAAGTEGPYEAALKGQSVQDPKQPLEILRTIHSFDPCLACAVHVVDPDGEELIRVRVQ